MSVGVGMVSGWVRWCVCVWGGGYCFMAGYFTHHAKSILYFRLMSYTIRKEGEACDSDKNFPTLWAIMYQTWTTYSDTMSNQTVHFQRAANAVFSYKCRWWIDVPLSRYYLCPRHSTENHWDNIITIWVAYAKKWRCHHTVSQVGNTDRAGQIATTIMLSTWTKRGDIWTDAWVCLYYWMVIWVAG